MKKQGRFNGVGKRLISFLRDKNYDKVEDKLENNIEHKKSDNSSNKKGNYVNIKYRKTLVNIDDYRFNSLNTSKSIFIKGAWYDEDNKYLILKLKNTYYHYCGVNKSIWNSFRKADSFGKYFNIYIKDKFDCRVGNIPAYE